MSEVEVGYYEKRRIAEEKKRVDYAAWLAGLKEGDRVVLAANRLGWRGLPFAVFVVGTLTKTRIRAKSEGVFVREFDRVTGRPRPRGHSFEQLQAYTPEVESANVRWAMIERVSRMSAEDWAKLPDEVLQKVIGTLNTAGR